MKNIIIVSLIILAQNLSIAQDYSTKLDSLKTVYIKDSISLEALGKQFENLKSKINVSTSKDAFEKIKAKADEIKSLKYSLNNTRDIAMIYVRYLDEEKKVPEKGELKDLVIFFKKTKLKELEATKEEKPTEPKVMLHFGDDKVISEMDILFNNKTYDNIFKEVLKSDSKTYLGDLVIPQDRQKIHLHKKVKKDTTIKKVLVKRIFTKNDFKKIKIDSTIFRDVFFKSVKIHAKHGLIQDIKILVEDENGNILLFENDVPITLLRFSRVASNNYMLYRHTISNNKNSVIDTSFVGSSIRLADVLMYINNPGENYVPDELQLNYPIVKDGKRDNAESSVIYEMRQDNSLENVLNLRTYTDFLGLFGDSPNGLIQIEGKADFYVMPFNFFNSRDYFLPKISPYINYARIDENERNLSVVDSSFTNNLDILQKTYLHMGIDLDIWNTRLRKEFPFDITLYGTARYNVSNLKETDSTSVDFRSLALGGGLRINVKRFNNFGLTLKSEMTKLDTNEFNDYNFVKNPGDFWVFRNEAEIFYHPAGDESQSIFLRLNTFNNASSGNNEAFFQLQFGYRFSVGLNKVKAK
jgi:hypothetical protein